jgi:hypothetical protein
MATYTTTIGTMAIKAIIEIIRIGVSGCVLRLRGVFFSTYCKFNNTILV